MNTNNAKCIVFGAGGHARILLDSLKASETSMELVVIDSNPYVSRVLDIDVAGTDEMVPSLIRHGFTKYILAIGSIGNTDIRRRIASFAEKQGLQPVSVIHPGAIVSPYAQLEDGVQIMAGAVVNPGALLRRHVIINSNAIVEHDCTIGEFSHVAPGATVTGRVHIGHDSHIGAAACIREQITIGDHVMVAAGAVVIHDVISGETVGGVPAHPLG